MLGSIFNANWTKLTMSDLSVNVHKTTWDYFKQNQLPSSALWLNLRGYPMTAKNEP